MADPIVRNDEVVGSIPTSSTNLLNYLAGLFAVRPLHGTQFSQFVNSRIHARSPDQNAAES